MNYEMNCSDLYLEYTDVKGKSHIRQHRVWDRERFIKSQVDSHTGPKVEPEKLVIVSLSDREAYLKQQRAGRA